MVNKDYQKLMIRRSVLRVASKNSRQSMSARSGARDSDLMRVLFCPGTERAEIEFARRYSPTRQRQLLNQRQQRPRIKPITD